MASLAELLFHDLGPVFPIASGNGKADDPLVVTDPLDYVSVEYAVVRHVLGQLREEFQIAQQSLIHRGGRVIDELIVHAKPVGEDDWTGSRRFYFDVTAGFSER